MKKLLAIATLSLAAMAHAQLPDAPSMVKAATPKPVVKQPWTRTELIADVSFLATNLGDYYTTQYFLARGGKEGELPTSLVASKPGFIAYNLAKTAGEILLDHKVRHSTYYREHRWLRVAVPLAELANAGVMARLAVNNVEYGNNYERIHAAPAGVTPVAGSTPITLHIK